MQFTMLGIVNLQRNSQVDEMLPEYEFDYRKARPNRFAEKASTTVNARSRCLSHYEKESLLMSSEAIATVVKMMESLPETAQDLVLEHLREYIEELRDELQWDSLFKDTQPQLIAAAKRARQEIAGGQAKPLDIDQL